MGVFVSRLALSAYLLSLMAPRALGPVSISEEALDSSVFVDITSAPDAKVVRCPWDRYPQYPMQTMDHKTMPMFFAGKCSISAVGHDCSHHSATGRGRSLSSDPSPHMCNHSCIQIVCLRPTSSLDCCCKESMHGHCSRVGVMWDVLPLGPDASCTRQLEILRVQLAE